MASLLNRVWRAAVIPSLVAALGCGQPEAETPSARLAHPGSASLLDASVGVIRLDLLYKVGELDGPPEYALGSVHQIVPGPDGGFFACDVQDMQVRSYDSNGTFVREVGRRGAGPGEYAWCASMLLVGDTALLISDANNGRLVLFDLDGRFKRTVAWPSAYPVVASDTDRGFWSAEFRRGRGGDEKSWNMLVKYGPGRVAVDSATLPSVRQAPGIYTFWVATSDGTLRTQLSDSIWSVGPGGGVATARAEAYRVRVLAGDGTVTNLERDLPPLEYRDNERTEWLRFISEQRLQPQAPLPDVKPAVRELRQDELSRVWVKVADTAYRAEEDNTAGRRVFSYREQGVWDLWNGRSELFIGQLRLPLGTELMATRGNQIWTLGAGAAGELVITAWHMRAP